MRLVVLLTVMVSVCWPILQTVSAQERSGLYRASLIEPTGPNHVVVIGSTTSNKLGMWSVERATGVLTNVTPVALSTVTYPAAAGCTTYGSDITFVVASTGPAPVNRPARVFVVSSLNSGRTWRWRWLTIPFTPQTLYSSCASSKRIAVLALTSGMNEQQGSLVTLARKRSRWVVVRHTYTDRGAKPFPAEGLKAGLVFTTPQTAYMTANVSISGSFYLYVSHDGGASWARRPISPGRPFTHGTLSVGPPVVYGQSTLMPVCKVHVCELAEDTSGAVRFLSAPPGLNPFPGLWVLGDREVVGQTAYGYAVGLPGAGEWTIVKSKALGTSAPQVMVWHEETGWAVSSSGQVFQTSGNSSSWILW